MHPWSRLTCVIIITPPSRLEPPSATKPGKSGEKQTKLQPWSAYIMCRRWRNIRLGTLVCLRHGKCAALKLHTRAETQHLSWSSRESMDTWRRIIYFLLDILKYNIVIVDPDKTDVKQVDDTTCIVLSSLHNLSSSFTLSSLLNNKHCEPVLVCCGYSLIHTSS